MRHTVTAPRCLFALCCLVASCNGKERFDDDPGAGPGADLSVSRPPDFAGTAADLQRGNRDGACASVRAEAMLEKKPVDIIMLVDNSGSMTDEIIAVERNINNSFADIIGKSGLDYRVILLAKHGITFLDQSICITMPLSGNPTCMPPPFCPVNGARFFHYNVDIESTDSLQRILSTYRSKDLCNAVPMGWANWLRPGTYKVFIEITDDNSAMGIDDFETKLFAMDPVAFGSALNRNYVFHTIAGLKENNPPTKAWGPMDPVQMTKCTRGGGAENPGLEYQKLSVRTGGLRFPICEHASFDAVFQNVAMGVVTGAKVACEFPIPMAPPNQQIDLNSVVVEYTPGGVGAPQVFKKVAGAAACAPASFYLSAGKIILCPEACTVVQGDRAAKVQVLFDCEAILG